MSLRPLAADRSDRIVIIGSGPAGNAAAAAIRGHDSKVPVTITSRSQTYTFRLAGLEVITGHLKGIAEAEKLSIDSGALEVIARRGGGSFRDSISLLDQITTSVTGEITVDLVNSALGLPSDALVERLLVAYAGGDFAGVRVTLQELLEQGIRAEMVAEELIRVIVGDPQPVFLPLVDRLLEVADSSRPEVKLLVALMSGLGASVLAETRVSASAGDVAARPTVGTPDTETDTTDHPPKNAETMPMHTGGSAKTHFDGSVPGTTWVELLAEAKLKNAALYAWLIKASGRVEGDVLKIFVTSKMAKMQLEKRQKDLVDYLPEGMGVEITDEPAKEDALVSELSSVFGRVEEVELV